MQHDFNWTHLGEQSDCRHCGWHESNDLNQLCTGDGVFERLWGMDATKTSNPDDGILCFQCSEELVRGTTEWFDKQFVLEAGDIEVGTTCRSCGREWSFHGDDVKRTPNMWIKRPAMMAMKEACDG